MTVPQIYNDFLHAFRNRGFARTSNFYVDFSVNTTTKRIPYNPLGGPQRIYPTVLPDEERKNMSVMCKSVSFPKRTVTTLDYTTKPGNTFKVATNYAFEQLVAISFYLTNDLREKVFIENWMNMAIDPTTKKANYYDEYAKYNTITVYSLPKIMAGGIATDRSYIPSPPITVPPVPGRPEIVSTPDQNKLGKRVYWNKFYQCYPIEIDQMDMGTDGENLLTMDVTFSYKYFASSADEEYPKLIDTQYVDTINS